MCRIWEIVRQLLSARASQTAILDDAGPTSAGELLEWVGCTAQLLGRTLSHPCQGSSEVPLVAVYLTNSACYVAAVLAALKAGAAFLPLDPRWPAHRLRQVFDEAQPAAILWAPPDAPGGHGQPAVAPHGVALLQLPSRPAVHSGGPGTEGHAATTQQAQRGAAGPQQPALPGRDAEAAGGEVGFGVPGRPLPYYYVLFTSGSTGAPLGVCGTEQGILNRCGWMQRAWPFFPGDRVAFRTSPCFVDSVWEVFGPLLAGCLPLVAIPPAASASPLQLLERCAAHRVTHLAAVPSLWAALAACLEQSPGVASGLCLRVAVSSGEPLPQGLLARLQQALPPSTAMLNLYGSTEVAADCTALDCTSWRPAPAQRPAAGTGLAGQAALGTSQPAVPTDSISTTVAAARVGVPVGSPISGMWVGIAAVSQEEPEREGGAERASIRLLPHGGASPHVGEVVVGGVGLAAGYIRQPSATARRFVQVPSTALPAGRLLMGGGPAVSAPAAAAAAAAGEADASPGPAGSGAGLSPARQGPAGDAGAASGTADVEGWQAGGGSVRLFMTGDLGYVDDAGHLWLCGRRDHQVKIGGVRVDLSEVEAALAQHPAVLAAAARLWQLPAGPALAAYVEVEQASPALAAHTGPTALPPLPAQQQAPALALAEQAPAALAAWCRQRLPPAAVPATVLVLPFLPRSAAGKVQRLELPPPPGWQQAQRSSNASGSGSGSVAPQPLPPQQLLLRPSGSPVSAVPEGAGAGEAAASGQGAAKRARLEEGPHTDQGAVPTAPASKPHPAPAALPHSLPRPAASPALQRQPISEGAVARAFAAALLGTLGALPVREGAPPPALEPTTNIFSLGANSLVVASIAAALGVPAELVYEHPSVRGLAACLRAQQAKQAKQREGAERRHEHPLMQLARPLLQGRGGGMGSAAADGAAAAAAAAAAGAAAQGGPLPGLTLGLAWAAQLLQCVDAPPLAAPLPPDGAATAAAPEAPHTGREGAGSSASLVFACSHGGDVRCFDAASGSQLWEALLPDQADVGMALCSATCPAANAPADACGSSPAAQQQGTGMSPSGTPTAVAAAWPLEGAAGWQAPLHGSSSGRGAVGPCVAVGTNGGAVFFLDACSGCELGSVDVGGGLRAPPLVDPWGGLVWVASHTKEVLVLAPPGVVLARQPCGAAVSAQVAFHQGRHMAFVACLDGSVVALRVTLGGGEEGRPAAGAPGSSADATSGESPGGEPAAALAPAAAGSARRHVGGRGAPATAPAPVSRSVQLEVAWRHEGSAPLFTPPLVVRDSEAGNDSSSGLVIAAAADGSIRALGAASGCLVWRCHVGSPVFTPLVQLSVHSAAGRAEAAPAAATLAAPPDDSGSGLLAALQGQRGPGPVGPQPCEPTGPSGTGAAPQEALPAPQASPPRLVVLTGTQAGDVFALDALSGTLLARAALGPRITGMCPLGEQDPSSRHSSLRQPGPAAGTSSRSSAARASHSPKDLALVCTQPGALCLLDVGAMVGGRSRSRSRSGGRSGGGLSASSEPRSHGAAQASSDGGREGGAGAGGICREDGLQTLLGSGCLLDVVRLPGEVFSVPALGREQVLVGCRDDHLYCLRLARRA